MQKPIQDQGWGEKERERKEEKGRKGRNKKVEYYSLIDLKLLPLQLCLIGQEHGVLWIWWKHPDKDEKILVPGHLM